MTKNSSGLLEKPYIVDEQKSSEKFASVHKLPSRKTDRSLLFTQRGGSGGSPVLL